MAAPLTETRPVSAAPPTLPASIRNRLGELLGAVYARNPEREAAAQTARFEALLERLRKALAELGKRDEAAFRHDFIELTPRLQRFAMSLAKDPAAADDLVQETLLRAWRSRSRFQTGTNLGAWLFTIMRNAFYSQHRKRMHEAADGDADLEERLAALPEQQGHLDLQDVQSALKRLPDPMRDALILVAVENLSYEEAAEVMRCRIGTVKSRVWRAREQLSVLLGYDGNEFGADPTTLSALAGSKAASFA